MGKSGGGGSSGAVSFPAYMQDIHRQWLNDWSGSGSSPFLPGEFPDVGVTMKNATSAIGGNPYTDAVAYSPDTDLDNAQDALDDFGADLASGWTSFLTSAMDGVDATIASPVEFDDRFDVTTDRIRTEQNKGIERFNARFVDITAIHSKTYAMSLVQQEQHSRDRIYEITTSQEDAVRNTRLSLLAQFGSVRLDGMRALAVQQAEVSRLTTIGKIQEQQHNQNVENSEATWDLDLFAYGGNVLAASAGGFADPEDKGIPWFRDFKTVFDWAMGIPMSRIF